MREEKERNGDAHFGVAMLVSALVMVGDACLRASWCSSLRCAVGPDASERLREVVCFLLQSSAQRARPTLQSGSESTV
jgi:hypothetical protein